MKNIYSALLLGVIMFVSLQSCNDFEPVTGVPEQVQFSTVSASVDESSPDPITITVQLLAPQKSSAIDIDYTLEETNLTEGVDYEFVGGSALTIPANSSTGTLQIQPIDNAEISEGSKSLKLTLTSANSNVSVGSETAPQRSIVVRINEDDFFCPRNVLAKVVTTETDFGYSSSAVHIEVTAESDECMGFEIIGGGGAIFGTTNIKFGNVAFIEDSPESMTGTIAAGDFELYPAAGGDAYANGDGDIYVLSISDGTYDLEAGTFQMTYILYAGSTPQFPGVLVYN